MPDERSAVLAALAAFGDAQDVQSVRDGVMHALSLWGIEAAYFLAPLTPDPRVGRLITNIGVSRIWERHYRARLHLIDPLPRIALRRSMAFFWPRDLEGEKLDPREQRFLDIIAKHGLAAGIGTVCYGPNGRAGFLGALWTKEEPPSDEVLLGVHQLGQVSFQRYCQILREEMNVEPLSNRELEVLEWMCRGKSNPVIAEIVGVSRSSVDTYIRRIFAKLDVTDRTAACVRAHSLGLTVTDEIARRIERAQRLNEGPKTD